MGISLMLAPPTLTNSLFLFFYFCSCNLGLTAAPPRRRRRCWSCSLCHSWSLCSQSMTRFGQGATSLPCLLTTLTFTPRPSSPAGLVGAEGQSTGQWAYIRAPMNPWWVPTSERGWGWGCGSTSRVTPVFIEIWRFDYFFSLSLKNGKWIEICSYGCGQCVAHGNRTLWCLLLVRMIVVQFPDTCWGYWVLAFWLLGVFLDL